ncbi:DUF1302 domain-containing protein [Marinobacter sp. X15-166B]|uniref:DUF1302 domain-containing protein n=1 Tax=Marinobacter sp. X15-166B TaxID=1897620 RepID=UPI00085C0413|nr:DUF1302 family protein [Marinobacter sp. X15-166B]OEY66301.1 hypothetical protein BG841_07415 [Marinobacter sp. X15-166B]
MKLQRALCKPSTRLSLRRVSLAVAAASCSSPVWALPTVSFDNGLTLQSQLTANYTLSARTGSASKEYLNDLNSDDGTRNFDEWGLINNRLSLFGEVIARYENLGAVLRGSHFYDDVYHQSNDNDSPDTVNKRGNHQRFTSETKDRSGGEPRLLDAYVFGNFALDNSQFLSLKAGRHLFVWGESLFWPNISQGQAPVDATKFNVPGTEAKDAYLPVGQVSVNYSLNHQLTFTGFWQYEWEETLLNPVGDFFGSDFFGPGSEFWRFAPGPVGPTTAFASAGEVKPGDDGQWGIGVRFNPNFNTELGLYHYRYHDRVPVLFFDATGTTRYSSAPDLRAAGPGTYQFKYFEDIQLTGVSVSTKVADAVQIGADVSLRDGAAVYLVNGAPTTGEILQSNLNAVYIIGPSFLAQQTTLLGEFVNQRIQGVDTLHVSGGVPGSNGSFDRFTSDAQTKSSSLYGAGIFLDYPSIGQGWDLTTSAVWTHNIAGSGIQGFGRDEKRLTLGADFTYLSNFSAGATLVNYLSSANIDRGRVLSDRDYLSFNFKYTF